MHAEFAVIALSRKGEAEAMMISRFDWTGIVYVLVADFYRAATYRFEAGDFEIEVLDADAFIGMNFPDLIEDY